MNGRLVNPEFGVDRLLQKRYQRLAIGTWIGYLLPFVLFLAIGLITKSSSEVGISLWSLFLGIPAALIGGINSHQILAARRNHDPHRNFHYFTSTTAGKLGALSCASGFLVLIPYGTGYWSSHSFSQQIGYWIALLLSIICIGRSLAYGRVGAAEGFGLI
jgi:hypothetical protein